MIKKGNKGPVHKWNREAGKRRNKISTYIKACYAWSMYVLLNFFHRVRKNVVLCQPGAGQKTPGSKDTRRFLPG